jgi:hypothetical protein
VAVGQIGVQRVDAQQKRVLEGILDVFLVVLELVVVAVVVLDVDLDQMFVQLVRSLVDFFFMSTFLSAP